MLQIIAAAIERISDPKRNLFFAFSRSIERERGGIR